jgi:hypothetical protein
MGPWLMPTSTNLERNALVMTMMMMMSPMISHLVEIRVSRLVAMVLRYLAVFQTYLLSEEEDFSKAMVLAMRVITIMT